jgi:peptidoglycan hydrolase CwlO-like protein
MTVEVALLISGISLAFALYAGISALKRSQRLDNQKDASEMTTVIVKLENISNGIAEIKADLGGIKAEIKELRDRMITVEQSVKSAWKRIEALEPAGQGGRGGAGRGGSA